MKTCGAGWTRWPCSIRSNGCGSRAMPGTTAMNAPTSWPTAGWNRCRESTMRKIVLDTETTGLDPRQGHRIIEVAAIEMDGRKVSKRTFHRYINPEREIDEGAAAVHGLTLDRLQDEPKFIEVAPALLEFIAGAELIIHNAPFDIGFLNAELALDGLPPLNNPVID